MKKYTISFNKIPHTNKPSGNEIAKISNGLYAKSIDYKGLAYAVGECGCTFSPAIYNGKHKKDNYIGQQLIALDFDNDVSFSEIKSRAEHYGLPILFAYKTFSHTEEHEKFRIVFALTDVITNSFTSEASILMFMKIFGECDEACKDSSRMFFGGKGLLELADKPVEISGQNMLIAFITYMNEIYGDTHYRREIVKFYQSIGLKHNKIIPVIEDGYFVYERAINPVKNSSSDNKNVEKGRRAVTRNFDWNALYDKCCLYRNFVDGREYYYYPQIFHIATNLINIEKGKNKFLEILNSENNAEYEAYHTRNWRIILNTLIEMDYQPQGCNYCPYADECLHYKNMILTTKPGNSVILQTTKKEYVSIEEAEQDLRANFQKAISSDKEGIHIIKAQTGIGKTNLYLDYLKNTDKKFLIAVPTHKLKMEVYNKAVYKGISDVAYTPEMPIFTSEIEEKINHIYNIGAGEYAIKLLRNIFYDMKPGHPDYRTLSAYLDAVESIKDFKGHIITTHDRLLLMRKDRHLLSDREVIIDEDIIRTMLSTHSINNKEIFSVINKGLFPEQTEKKFKSIVAATGYQRYDYKENGKLEITEDVLSLFENTEDNILDLSESCYVYNNGTETTFLKRKWLPCKKAIVMSATVNPDIYKMLTHYDVHYYPCKMAKYVGELELYPKYSFSRHALLKQDDIVDYIKSRTGENTIITFKDFEQMFDTAYHYGAIEGLNCLEGKNISVVGLPNVNEVVYKLYGMAAGINVNNFNMHCMRTEYNGYSFCINSFDNEKLRTIQLWMLESLLEQAVGRARLLRFDCTVKVFARFPTDQAIIQ